MFYSHEAGIYIAYMNNPLPPLIPLRAFECAARHESFSKAAEELHVTHSAISQNIRQLEDRLGIELFIRSGNRIKLSPKGKTYQEKISAAYQLIITATEELTGDSPRHTLTVSAEPAFAARLLRPRLAKFRAEYPSIQLHLISDRQNAPINFDDVDIAIQFQNNPLNVNLHQETLCTLHGTPACNPKLLKSASSIKAPVDLANFPLIHDKSTQLWDKWLQANELINISFDSDQHFHDFSLAIDAAIDGEGIILADDILCEAELSDGRLVKLFSNSIECVSYCMITAKNNANKAHIKQFKNWLLTELS